jgi:hypothetical protein
MAIETKEPPKKPAAEATKTKTPVATPELPPAKSGTSTASFRLLKTLKGDAASLLLVVSVFLNGLGFAYFWLAPGGQKTVPDAEIALGEFRFISYHAGADQVAEAQFAVYIALNEPVKEEARRRVEERKFRLQQEIEELLRAAHSGDFDDPLLRGIKSKLVEQINKSLGMRAIDAVIITNLKVVRTAAGTKPTEKAVELVPWVEQQESSS